MFCISDDLTDNNNLRSSVKCWHKHNDVGVSISNDIIILHECYYQIIMEYCAGKDFCLDMMNLFHQSSLGAAYAQSLDLLVGMDKAQKP